MDKPLGEANPKHLHIAGQNCPVCGTSWQKNQETKPIPKELKQISSSHCETLTVEPFREGTVTLKNGQMIQAKRQEKSNDCGPTALMMLGYSKEDVQKIMNGENRELNTHDVYKMNSSTWIQGEAINYDNPHLQIVEMKSGSNHWITRMNAESGRELIVCPAYGVFDKQDYMDRFVSKMLYQFEVPIVQQAQKLPKIA